MPLSEAIICWKYIKLKIINNTDPKKVTSIVSLFHDPNALILDNAQDKGIELIENVGIIQ